MCIQYKHMKKTIKDIKTEYILILTTIIVVIVVFLRNTSNYSYAEDSRFFELVFNASNVQDDTYIQPDFEIESVKVDRVSKLKNFLKEYNSPLVDNTETFIQVADKFNLDYRLLPAISCMESGCGKHMIEGSYNPFGWGIYGDTYISFNSFDEAIQTVGEGIYSNYVLKGANDVYEIAPIYTPPNHVNWLNGVTYFMNQIDEM